MSTAFHTDTITIGGTLADGSQCSGVEPGRAWNTVSDGCDTIIVEVARIVAVGGRSGLERDFIPSRGCSSRPELSLSIIWPLPEEGVFEVTKLSTSHAWVRTAPVYVEAHAGQHRVVSREEVEDALVRQATGYADLGADELISARTLYATGLTGSELVEGAKALVG